MKKPITEGQIVISNSESAMAPAVIVSDNGVYIVGRSSSTGISIDNTGVTIQGGLLITASGKDIKKGRFSENPKGSKIFSYTETISMEGDIKEKLSEAAGKMGINTSELSKGGSVPLMTDIAYGPLPHYHNMMFKHVHRVEPAYLYRVPRYVKMLTGFIPKLVGFLAS